MATAGISEGRVYQPTAPCAAPLPSTSDAGFRDLKQHPASGSRASSSELLPDTPSAFGHVTDVIQQQQHNHAIQQQQQQQLRASDAEPPASEDLPQSTTLGMPSSRAAHILLTSQTVQPVQPSYSSPSCVPSSASSNLGGGASAASSLSGSGAYLQLESIVPVPLRDPQPQDRPAGPSITFQTTYTAYNHHGGGGPCSTGGGGAYGTSGGRAGASGAITAAAAALASRTGARARLDASRAALNAKLAGHPMSSLAHYNCAVELTRQIAKHVVYPSPYTRGRSAYKLPGGKPEDAPEGWRDQVEQALVASSWMGPYETAAAAAAVAGDDCVRREHGGRGGGGDDRGSGGEALQLDGVHLRRGCILLVVEYSRRLNPGPYRLLHGRLGQEETFGVLGAAAAGVGGAAPASSGPALGRGTGNGMPPAGAQATAQSAGANVSGVRAGDAASGLQGPPALSREDLVRAFGRQLVQPDGAETPQLAATAATAATAAAAAGGGGHPLRVQHFSGPTGGDALVAAETPLTASGWAVEQSGAPGGSHGCGLAVEAGAVPRLVLLGPPCMLASAQALVLQVLAVGGAAGGAGSAAATAAGTSPGPWLEHSGPGRAAAAEWRGPRRQGLPRVVARYGCLDAAPQPCRVLALRTQDPEGEAEELGWGEGSGCGARADAATAGAAVVPSSAVDVGAGVAPAAAGAAGAGAAGGSPGDTGLLDDLDDLAGDDLLLTRGRPRPSAADGLRGGHRSRTSAWSPAVSAAAAAADPEAAEAAATAAAAGGASRGEEHLGGEPHPGHGGGGGSDGYGGGGRLYVVAGPCQSPGMLLLEMDLDVGHGTEGPAGHSMAAAGPSMPLLSAPLPVVVVDDLAVQREVNSVAAAAVAAAATSTTFDGASGAAAMAAGGGGATGVDPQAAAAEPAPLEQPAPDWLLSFLYDLGQFLELSARMAAWVGIAARGDWRGAGGGAGAGPAATGAGRQGVGVGTLALAHQAPAAARDAVGYGDVGLAACELEAADWGDGDSDPGHWAANDEDLGWGDPAAAAATAAAAVREGDPQRLLCLAASLAAYACRQGLPALMSYIVSRGARAGVSLLALDEEVGRLYGGLGLAHLAVLSGSEEVLQALLLLTRDDTIAGAAATPTTPIVTTSTCTAVLCPPLPAAVAPAAAAPAAAAMTAAAVTSAAPAVQIARASNAPSELSPPLSARAALSSRRQVFLEAAAAAPTAAAAAPPEARCPHAVIAEAQGPAAAAVATCVGVAGQENVAVDGGGSGDMGAGYLHKAGEHDNGGGGGSAAAADKCTHDRGWAVERLMSVSACTALFVRPGPGPGLDGGGGGVSALHLLALLHGRAPELAPTLLSVCPMAAHAWFLGQDAGGSSAAQYALQAGSGELNEQCQEQLVMEALDAEALGCGAAERGLLLAAAQQLAALLSGTRAPADAPADGLRSGNSLPGGQRRSEADAGEDPVMAAALSSSPLDSTPGAAAAAAAVTAWSGGASALCPQLARSPLHEEGSLQHPPRHVSAKEPGGGGGSSSSSGGGGTLRPARPAAGRGGFRGVASAVRRLPWSAPLRGFSDPALERDFAARTAALALKRNRFTLAFCILVLAGCVKKILVAPPPPPPSSCHGTSLLVSSQGSALGALGGLLPGLGTPLSKIVGSGLVEALRLRGWAHDCVLAAAELLKGLLVGGSHLAGRPHPEVFEVADLGMQEALTSLFNCLVLPVMEQMNSPVMALVVALICCLMEWPMLISHGWRASLAAWVLLGRLLVGLTVRYGLQVWARTSYLEGVRTRDRCGAKTCDCVGKGGSAGAAVDGTGARGQPRGPEVETVETRQPQTGWRRLATTPVEPTRIN